MTYFVQRNGQGTIVGLYGNPCVGIAEEALPDDNPGIVAFLNPPPSITDYQDAIQSHIDATAVSKQFNDGVTLASYKASTNALWASQATAFIAWRDQVWEQAYVKMASVQAGQIPQPTVADVVASLPAIVWPS
jgi:hypothetical protein